MNGFQSPLQKCSRVVSQSVVALSMHIEIDITVVSTSYSFFGVSGFIRHLLHFFLPIFFSQSSAKQIIIQMGERSYSLCSVIAELRG